MVKELESLIGKLQHTSNVVRPGRTFMRWMFELLRGTKKNQQWVRLNFAVKSDLHVVAHIHEPVEWHINDASYFQGELGPTALLKCLLLGGWAVGLGVADSGSSCHDLMIIRARR